jgi:hypothetical protein
MHQLDYCGGTDGFGLFTVLLWAYLWMPIFS